MTNPQDLGAVVDFVATRVEARLTDMVVRLALLGLFVSWALDLVGPFVQVGPASVVLPLLVWE